MEDREEWPGWVKLTTLDHNPDCKPDIEADLECLPYTWARDNEYNEIHAYDVLEHTGQQGDFRFFFAQWSEFWRILKPDGIFYGRVPPLTSKWLWGDPGHKRVISLESLTFLSQLEYDKQLGKTALCDYRRWYSGDFEAVRAFEHNDCLDFALRAVKPPRFK